MSLLLALALLGSAQNEARVNQGLSTIALVPVGLDAALAEFDRLCLAAPFDRAAFAGAAARSNWRFRRDPDSGPEGALGYVASRGYTKLIDARPLPQCNFDSALRQGAGRDATIARVEALLARRFGAVPARQETANTLFWPLPGETEQPLRLYLMRRPGDDARQFSLSLQKWPAALAGSGARPQEPRP